MGFVPHFGIALRSSALFTKRQVAGIFNKNAIARERKVVYVRVAIGADHAGFPLKEELKAELQKRDIEYVDFGTFSNESVDYPDFAGRVAENVASGEFDRGVLVCGSGIGVTIVANKVPGARAALCGDIECARLSRQHNDANILTLGARVTDWELAKEILVAWLETDFEGGRHARRVEKIRELERRFCRSNESANS